MVGRVPKYDLTYRVVAVDELTECELPSVEESSLAEGWMVASSCGVVVADSELPGSELRLRDVRACW